MASYKPTKGMKSEAQKGLDWRREHGRGGTAVGIARARDIVSGKNLSESTVKRMFSFFSRHEVDKKAEGFSTGEKGFPSNGRIAWALWGGDAGFRWSKTIVDRLKKEDDGRMAEDMDNKVERHIKDVRETEDSYIVEFGKSMPEENDEARPYHDDEEERAEDMETQETPIEERSIDTNEEHTKEEINEIAEQEYVAKENEEALRYYAEENVQRAFQFDRTKIDEDKRTIRIGVSTEIPVQRSFGYEVLGHNSDEIDMEFMASGRSPLLLDHDATKQIGVVEEFGIDPQNKRTVAKVRFSKNPQAEEVFRDVVDGIRQNISVGYQVNKMEKEGERDGIPIFRVRGWTPLEVSAVSIPADQSSSVGFGRSKDVNLDKRKTEITMSNENEKVVPEVNAEDVRSEMAKENAAIIDLAIKHNKRDLGNEAVSKGVSLAQFRGQLLETIANDKPLDLPSSVDMTETEQREYSLIKAVQEAAAGKLSGLEKEVSDEIAQRTGKEARGFYMPTNIAFGKRDQEVGTNSSGGFLKGTDHLGNEFIEALYSKLVIGQAGARVMNGLKGDVSIPKMSASVNNAAFVDESNAPTESAATFSQVTMSPKTLAAYVDVSRRLMLQSDPSVEAVLRNDVINTFARNIDAVAIEGGGSNEPSGIIASVSGNVQALGDNGAAIAYTDIVDMIKLVEEDNAILNDAAVRFIGNPKVTAKLRTTLRDSADTASSFILGGDNKMLGYDYLSTNLVPSDLSKGSGSNLSAMLFGDFSQLMLGFWSGVDVIVDPYTGSNTGTTRLAFFQDLDIALRHDDAFAVCKDIVTT